jgi:hyperosmotically inducible protein
MSPPVKTDVPQERDVKEKETSRKPVASLILTVKLALMADPRLFQYEIEAGEDQHTITLSGRVSSEEEKTAASDVARTVTGVKAVINKLEVSKDLLQAVAKKRDGIITQLVKDQFVKSATLKAANFEVKTEDGIVSLSGAVRFQVIALEAAEAARQVPGVRAVKTDKVRLEGEG